MSEGKLSLDAQYCWVDVWAFLHTIEKIEHILGAAVKQETKKGNQKEMAADELELFK